MNVVFVPQRFFWRRLADGWKLAPGHSFNPKDYAVLMLSPSPEPLLGSRKVKRATRKVREEA